MEFLLTIRPINSTQVISLWINVYSIWYPIKLSIYPYTSYDYNYTSILCMYVCMAITYKKSKDQPGKVANPARGQMKRENGYFPVLVRA